ncbi:MAG: radical SAM protein [Candidatus Aenigmatarchaeota archaeon]
MKVQLKKAQVHLTNKCNLKCIFCDIPIRYRGCVDLEDEKFIQVTKELCELKPEIITISGGGEPLLRPKLISFMVKSFHSYGIESEIITNGVLITDKIAKIIAECSSLYKVSLHSTSVKLDEFLRGVRGSLKMSFEGIKKVAKWKAKMKKDKPEISIVMVLTKHNINEIEKMIKIASKFKVNKISLRIAHKYGEIYKPDSFQFRYLQKNMKHFEDLAKRKNIVLDQDFLPEVLEIEDNDKENKWREKYEDKSPFCTLPFNEMVIFADGRVAPCCIFLNVPETIFPVESIKNKTLKNIWFGERFNELRESMLKRHMKKIPEMCIECSIDLKSIDKKYRK